MILTMKCMWGCLCLLFAIASTVWSEAGAGMTVCPIRSQQLISENRTLLPVQNIHTSSGGTAATPVGNFVTLNTSPWCSNDTLLGQYISMTFTERIVLTSLQSGGFLNGYAVNNFTIEYALDDQDFVAYGVIETPQEFLVDVSSPFLRDAHFTLEKPLVATRIRFLINGAVLDPSGRLCWEVTLFGCPLSEATSINTTGISENVTPTSCPQATMPASDVEHNSPTPTTTTTTTPTDSYWDTLMWDDIHVLILPTAIATLLLVAAITTTGVVICLCTTSRRRKQERRSAPQVQGAARKMDTPNSSRADSASIASLYQTRESTVVHVYQTIADNDSPREDKKGHQITSLQQTGEKGSGTPGSVLNHYTVEQGYSNTVVPVVSNRQSGVDGGYIDLKQNTLQRPRVPLPAVNHSKLQDQSTIAVHVESEAIATSNGYLELVNNVSMDNTRTNTMKMNTSENPTTNTGKSTAVYPYSYVDLHTGNVGTQPRLSKPLVTASQVKSSLTTDRPPPTTNRPPPTTEQPLHTTDQLPPTTDHPPSTANRPPPTTVRAPPTTVRPPPTTNHPPPTTDRPPPTIDRPPPTTVRPPPTTDRPLPTTNRPPLTTDRPLS